MAIFVQAAAQISIQEPLCDGWFDEPIMYEQNMVVAKDPSYKALLEPNVARRIGKMLKRALVTSNNVMQESGVTCPDAIIVGTGLGCVESTEKFLSAMKLNGEEFLQPTHFMQSTHNTVSSQIAVSHRCHGYNSTHVQDGVSFESALLDAFMNFELAMFSSALVAANDELTPAYFTLLDKINYWKKEPVTQLNLLQASTSGSFSGEVSVSFMLQNQQAPSSLCRVDAVEVLHKPSEQQLGAALSSVLNSAGIGIAQVDAVVIGKSGDRDNDLVYQQVAQQLFPNVPQVWYKHIFGESYSASALAMYVAAICLKRGRVPEHLILKGLPAISNPKHILLYNHFQNANHSFILLSSC